LRPALGGKYRLNNPFHTCVKSNFHDYEMLRMDQAPENVCENCLWQNKSISFDRGRIERTNQT